MNLNVRPELVKRTFLPFNVEVSNWEQIRSYFEQLLNRNIDQPDQLRQWLKDRSELEAFLQEDFGWRYIRMSCDTTNQAYTNAFNFFVGEIQPQIAPLSHELDLKLLKSPALDSLPQSLFRIMLREIRQRVEIFREDNIPLLAALQQQEQEYSMITGAMTIMADGKEMTLQQAGNYLELDDREKRMEIFLKISQRRLQDKTKLDELMNDLIGKRNEIASNAGFNNYRDYAFASLGRFDYTPDDCLKFHQAIATGVVPLHDAIEDLHRRDLSLSELKPWDTAATVPGESPLRPCKSAAELMDKTISCFFEISPFLGQCMQEMKDAGRLDLESRKGKAPGGYNYPLYETGLPFIFMNSTNSLRDLVTLVHEGGHAVHSILNKPLEVVDFKNIPSEVAELASMAMELISMEHWHHFFENESELRKARRKHLEDILKGLPWIACIDAFQHWIYTHVPHSVEERTQAWNRCFQQFSGSIVDWNGQEEIKSSLWQKQLHIFEVPFYYIEYGFAQLGAIAIWRNYRNDPSGTIQNYMEALRMGNTSSIGEIYKRAGIKFEFSESYILELCDFVKHEWQVLVDE